VDNGKGLAVECGERVQTHGPYLVIRQGTAELLKFLQCRNDGNTRGTAGKDIAFMDISTRR
jgi:hypothetical protein